jgi:hypothetical protein
VASDQVEQLINDVTGIADIDPGLARMFVRDAGRRTLEVRHWSFLYRRNQLSAPAAVSSVSLAATASVVQNSTRLTFSSPIATPGMVGQQLRFSAATNVIGSAGPIFDIVGYDDASHIEIWPPYGTATTAALPFTIFTCFFQLPRDFMMFDSVVDPVYRRRLRTNVPREALDRYDAGRSRLGGPAALLSPIDYSPTSVGTMTPIVQAFGSGPKPLASGSYTGQSDALFTIRIDGGGLGGVATFSWKRDEGPLTSSVLSDTGIGNLLSDSVMVLFNAAAVYVLGDVFVLRVSATSTIGVPRVEIYPYQSSLLVFPYTYIARFPDITDDGVVLPGIIGRRDDVIREKALEMAATYPGTPDRPNNYAQINRRDYHATNWRALVTELDREDNETRQTNVKSDPYFALPFAALPWMSGSDLQSFDPPWIYPDWPGYA